MTSSRITVEELVVHAFYPLDGPGADEAYRRVRARWEAWRPLMGRMIVGTDLPTQPPAERADVPTETGEDIVIAGQESAGGDWQALLRRRHDVLNLSVAFGGHIYDASRSARSRRRVPTKPGWVYFDRQWEEMTGGVDDLMLGEARLYLATAEDLPRLGASDDLAQAARSRLPPGHQDPDWWAAAATTDDGLAIWEVSPRSDSRVLRRIVVLAPADRDAELSAWTWSNGKPIFPPFARYLLNAAKLHYQVRVWNQGRELARLRTRTADSVARFRSSRTADLTDLKAVEIDIASALAALSAMKRTVQIAADNMTRNLAGSIGNGVGTDLFGNDRELARWFGAQLDDDTAYLETDRDLLRQVSSIAAPREPVSLPPPAPNAVTASGVTIGILTALPEEFHAMRTLLEHPEEISVPPDFARYVRGTLPSRDAARPHQVVLTQTGDTGTNAAADAATNLSRSFRTVDCLLMVGIAAGVPAARVPERHVRLGDIVVATWGIVDYAHVVMRGGRVELRQPFPRPWQLLRRVAAALQADELRGKRPWEQWLDISGNPELAEYGRPPNTTDVLTPPSPGAPRPRHPLRNRSGHRPGFPKVHYGLIGSANISLRDARLRDQLAAEHYLRAFEMEGAGVGTSAFLNDRHWFMVRGISDYADRGFGTAWRKYASLAAAAYVRALLSACQPLGPDAGHLGG